jgi:hypothetical protein
MTRAGLESARKGKNRRESIKQNAEKAIVSLMEEGARAVDVAKGTRKRP